MSRKKIRLRKGKNWITVFLKKVSRNRKLQRRNLSFPFPCRGLMNYVFLVTGQTYKHTHTHAKTPLYYTNLVKCSRTKKPLRWSSFWAENCPCKQSPFVVNLFSSIKFYLIKCRRKRRAEREGMKCSKSLKTTGNRKQEHKGWIDLWTLSLLHNTRYKALNIKKLILT